MRAIRTYIKSDSKVILHACRLRFKTLAAPVRPCGVAKISKAGENLKKLNLGQRHWLSRVPEYT